MKRALVVIHRPNKEDSYRIVMYPDFKEPGFYRQILSLDAFKNREMARAFPDGKWKNKKITWATIKYESDFLPESNLDTIEIWTCGKTWEDLPVSKDVWQFYKDIGYNYKKQKYE
jgi:hypothetical protein